MGVFTEARLLKCAVVPSNDSYIYIFIIMIRRTGCSFQADEHGKKDEHEEQTCKW